MGSGSKKKKQKPEKDHLARSSYIGNDLAAEGERGCVLVGCAKVEDAITLLLKAFFAVQNSASQQRITDALDLAGKNPQALFSSGWAKATTAHLIGLIDSQSYELYNGLRRLRNDFAHHPGGVTLTDAAVDPLVALLSDREKQDLDLELERHRRGESLFGQLTEGLSEPRIKLMHACIYLSARIFWKRIDIDPPPYHTGILVAEWSSPLPEGNSPPQSETPPPELPPEDHPTG